MSIIRNTADVAWDSKVYGAVGSGVGFAGSLLYAFANQAPMNGTTFKVAAVAGLGTGLVTQMVGMLITNYQQGGRGLSGTVMGLTGGFGAGAVQSLRNNPTEPVGVIKAGLVGGVIGGSLGATGDVVRATILK
mgnify:FL=1